MLPRLDLQLSNDQENRLWLLDRIHADVCEHIHRL